MPTPLPQTPSGGPGVWENVTPWDANSLAPGPIVDGPVGPLGPAGPIMNDGSSILGGDGCCSDACCDPSCGRCLSCCDCRCGLPGPFWASAEYLLWTMRSAHLPPLVTTTSLTPKELLLLSADPRFHPGGTTQPGTSILFGDKGNSDFGADSGGRFTLGISGPCHNVGFETTFFFLAPQSSNFGAVSDGSTFLFRPFRDVTPGMNGASSAEIVALGTLAGMVNVHYDSQLWGIEENLRLPLLCGCNYKLDLLAGFRYLDLSESLAINESVTSKVAQTVNGQMLNAGDNFAQTDSFRTLNHFYGGQIGLDFQYRSGRWNFGVTPKVAFGTVHEVVNIDGNTYFNPVGGPQSVATGGLLALPTNIGHHTADRFAVLPELGLKIGYQFNEHLEAFVGYNFMYLSNVVRVADQVDLNVNTTQIPTQAGPRPLVGPANPAVVFQQTGFWAQGATAGLKWVW
jgi:hypothetical protein